MSFLARPKAVVAITAFVLVAAAAAGALAGLGQAGRTRTHAPKPYLQHPEYALKAFLLAKAGGIHVTPALRAAARVQAARPRMLWRGASARFSVLGSGAAPSQLPPEVHRFAAFVASTTHLSHDTALARVKLLRSRVGSAGGSLYGLQGGHRSAVLHPHPLRRHLRGGGIGRASLGDRRRRAGRQPRGARRPRAG